MIEDGINISVQTGTDSLQLEILKNRTHRLEGFCCNPKGLITAVNLDQVERSSETLVAAYLEIADSLTLAGKSIREHSLPAPGIMWWCTRAEQLHGIHI